MKHKIREVIGAMTAFPYQIDSHAKAVDATRLMDAENIRHLPVVENERIVGLLSRRELDVAGLFGGLMDTLTVMQLCTKNPYIVAPTERLDIVVEEMSRRKIGSAIVIRGNKLVGILTTTDVCRLLAETLREGHKPPGGDDEAA